MKPLIYKTFVLPVHVNDKKIKFFKFIYFQHFFENWHASKLKTLEDRSVLLCYGENLYICYLVHDIWSSTNYQWHTGTAIADTPIKTMTNTWIYISKVYITVGNPMSVSLLLPHKGSETDREFSTMSVYIIYKKWSTLN